MENRLQWTGWFVLVFLAGLLSACAGVTQVNQMKKSAQSMMPSPKPTIIFLDTGNTGRSVMAEEIAKRYINNHHLGLHVISRGIKVRSISPYPEVHAQHILKHCFNINVENHIAAALTRLDLQQTSLVLTMSEQNQQDVLKEFPQSAAHKIQLLSVYAQGNYIEIKDAWGKPYEAYVTVYHQLNHYIPLAIDRFMRDHEDSP